jgi:CRP-like cAMP-binding protein
MEIRQMSRLRIISLFEDLTDAELARIAQSCVTRAYGRHDRLPESTITQDDVFFILDGSVRINSISSMGREIIFSDLGTGHIFGEFPP